MKMDFQMNKRFKNSQVISIYLYIPVRISIEMDFYTDMRFKMHKSGRMECKTHLMEISPMI